ncbi:MAG: SDR family oxidoreductase [Proteobacteria bacterium]|nr:SDR family oxidoreductase [Pseudomonadota bacterium]
MSKIKFDNRVVVITGAGSGLGKCYALEFAKRGAKVVVNDPGGALDGSGQNAAAADLVVKEIIDAGGIAVANHDSVASRQGGENIVKTALDQFGTVDVLVNNAGIIRDKSILKITEDDWDAVIAVHLKGAFCVTQPAFAVMKEKGYGRIVNTSSGAGLYGNFGQCNYGSAKMALVGLMNSIFVEGAKYNISCNCIAPIAASRMTENLMPQEVLEKLKPEFIAPLVLYLCSEQNKDNKMIFNCAGGWFSRTEILCSSGMVLGDGKREILPEEIMEHWDTISGLENTKPLSSLMESFTYLSGIM